MARKVQEIKSITFIPKYKPVKSEWSGEIRKALNGLNELHSLWLAVVKLELRLNRCKHGSPKWVEYDSKRTTLSNLAMEYTSTIRFHLMMSLESEDPKVTSVKRRDI